MIFFVTRIAQPSSIKQRKLYARKVGMTHHTLSASHTLYYIIRGTYSYTKTLSSSRASCKKQVRRVLYCTKRSKHGQIWCHRRGPIHHLTFTFALLSARRELLAISLYFFPVYRGNKIGQSLAPQRRTTAVYILLYTCTSIVAINQLRLPYSTPQRARNVQRQHVPDNYE